jgi:archaellum component FlaG (FlaF/FlaG flagellin family)
MTTSTLTQLRTGAPAAALADADLLETEQSGVSKGTTVGEVAAHIRRVPINNQTGTTYTLVLTDAGKVARMSNAASITVTVPANATVAFTVGDTVSFRQVAAGQVILSPAVGVTINSPQGFDPETARLGSTMMLHKVGTNEWDLTGDLAAS